MGPPRAANAVGRSPVPTNSPFHPSPARNTLGQPSHVAGPPCPAHCSRRLPFSLSNPFLDFTCLPYNTSTSFGGTGCLALFGRDACDLSSRIFNDYREGARQRSRNGVHTRRAYGIEAVFRKSTSPMLRSGRTAVFSVLSLTAAGCCLCPQITSSKGNCYATKTSVENDRDVVDVP